MNAVVKYAVLLIGLSWLTACQQTPTQEVITAEPTATESEPEPVAETVVECQCPEPEVAAAVEAPVTEPCPPPPAVKPQPAKPVPKAVSGRQMLVLGRVEYVDVIRMGSDKAPLKIKSRIDTGAALSSLDAHKLVDFERDGEPWVRFAVLEPKTDKPIFFERRVNRFVENKQAGTDAQRRPVVNVSLRLGNLEENLEVTLTDSGDSVYQILIGRNFLRDRAVVDVSRKFIADDAITIP